MLRKNWRSNPCAAQHAHNTCKQLCTDVSAGYYWVSLISRRMQRYIRLRMDCAYHLAIISH